METVFNIFGSENSIDYDVMVFVDEIPTIAECKKRCLEFDKELEEILGTEKKINTNLAVLKGDIIVDVFKGVALECNNSIFHTYDYHPQPHPQQIKKTVWYCSYPPLKCARALRILLSFLSRTEHRPKVKAALRGNASDKIKVLREIRMSEIEDFGKNNQDKYEIYKTVAFQIGQTLGMLGGDELYTKNKIATFYQALRPFLAREDGDIKILDLYKCVFLSKIQHAYQNIDEVVKE